MEIFVAVGAFIILAVMLLLLHRSTRHEGQDPVTQEIIIKANTGPVIVHAPVTADPTQEDGK